MSASQNRKLIERWYQALAEDNFETIFDRHNFSDTVLVEQCLFDNALQKPEQPLSDPFQIS